MLKLRDFMHLPQVDNLVAKLVDDEPGLILLAGIDARPTDPLSSEMFRPSGLSAIFNILLQEILLAHPRANAIVIAEDKATARVPRQISRRVRFVRAEPPFTYQGQIEIAVKERPDLIVVDHLTEEILPAAFQAASAGVRVLTQFDTVLRGSSVARQMVELGVPRSQLSALRWIFTNQRMPVLCNKCKQPVAQPEELLEHLKIRFPHLSTVIDECIQNTAHPTVFYQAGSCDTCHGTGYQGDIAVFDIFHNDPQVKTDIFHQNSMLSLEEYTLRLAMQGQIDLGDLLDLESNHLRHIYQMFTTTERSLAQTSSTLNRKLLELEASNRVLVQRTEVLMSLQDLGQALITSTDLHDLAARICRRAGELCGSDRVVFYLRRIMEEQVEVAEILAERGWGSEMTGRTIEARLVFGQSSAAQASMRAARYVHIPPGFRTEIPGKEAESSEIKTGLHLPLFAQNQLVGVMIVQSTQKETFTQGEMALLHTFANQAALAIQRAGLVEELRAKITQLEEAQTELVKKERMERELELARQVQQSMLPHQFPEVPGYSLYARSEPARQVGGDFYDVIVLDDAHFGIVVADVADKGLPAAMYMSLTRSLLRAEARRTLSPREALLNVNRLLLELGELNGFVSVFYAVVETSSHHITYARAGHERALLVRDHNVRQFGGAGMVLGILEEDNFELTEEKDTLTNGDRLILYTDGLTDVLDATGHFSGIERLQQLLQARASDDAQEICTAIFEEMNAFRGSVEQFDDMTLLVLEVI